MVEYRLVYQIGFFVLAPRIEADSRTIMRVMREFEGLNYIPTTFIEAFVGPHASSRKGLRLVSEDEERSLNFEQNRAVFQWEASPFNNPSFESFKSHASEVMARVEALYGEKANRLSFITRGIYPEISSDHLERVYSRLVSPIDFYANNNPFEWSLRSVAGARCEAIGSGETLNIITELRRSQGSLHIEDSINRTDRIDIGFDINTHQDRKDPRFMANHFSPFLDFCHDQVSRIESEVEVRINE